MGTWKDKGGEDEKKDAWLDGFMEGREKNGEMRKEGKRMCCGKLRHQQSSSHFKQNKRIQNRWIFSWKRIMRMMKNRCGTWRQDMLTADMLTCWVCSATCGERTAKVRSPRTTGCPKRRGVRVYQRGARKEKVRNKGWPCQALVAEVNITRHVCLIYLGNTWH
ncbi:hypothetical protein ILYODFUR_010442 [Ilyodon furcidens]|uniref:Uncharacterized protein n=1 Tax=Ilyodon furcidens TaxID=33524 RepID=A0ABV0THI5_9TELE